VLARQTEILFTRHPSKPNCMFNDFAEISELISGVLAGRSLTASHLWWAAVESIGTLMSNACLGGDASQFV
jgi:hypothetical protein